jgi:hypothetical protein
MNPDRVVECPQVQAPGFRATPICNLTVYIFLSDVFRNGTTSEASVHLQYLSTYPVLRRTIVCVQYSGLTQLLSTE